jgi:hypothetical protein
MSLYPFLLSSCARISMFITLLLRTSLCGQVRFLLHYICMLISRRYVLPGLKSAIFWDKTPCSPLKFNRRFGGTYSTRLHGRISRAKYQRESRLQAGRFHAGNLLDLFDSEYGSHMSFRNVGWLSTGYTALYPRGMFKWNPDCKYVEIRTHRVGSIGTPSRRTVFITMRSPRDCREGHEG